MPRLVVLLLALLAAPPAAAQPTGRAVLDAWVRTWERAARDVVAIEAEETQSLRVDGPRGAVVLGSEAAVTYGRDGTADREVRRLTADGRPVDPDRFDQSRRRTQRAFGRGGQDALAPPPLAVALLARAEPQGIAPDRVDGQRAWRVALDLPGAADRATAWFSRDRAPRLLRVHLEGARPGGRFERTVAFAPADGLDLAVAATTALTVRQRRRLRDYVVTLTAEGRYGRYRVVRR